MNLELLVRLRVQNGRSLRNGRSSRSDHPHYHYERNQNSAKFVAREIVVHNTVSLKANIVGSGLSYCGLGIIFGIKSTPPVKLISRTLWVMAAEITARIPL
jgi:hypothetical protein